VREVRPRAVAIYIRWSTDEQTEGTTLETQKERCSLYVRSQGWEVNPDLLFVDEGFSGGSLDRPAMSRLRKCVQAGQVDCVVTYSMDRLSRSVADTVQLVEQEWLGKCVYRSASQPISTDEGNPTGQLIFNILASFAEFERALIRERTHSGLVRRVKQGKYPGTKVPPFGYRRDGKGRLIIDSVSAGGTLSGPAAVVHRIFELATMGPMGQGPTLVARALAAEGIPSPTGGPWWAAVVRAMLTNPVYAGDVVYGRRRVNPAHRRDKSAPQRLYNQRPLAVVAGGAPAIVSRQLWDQAQKLFATRAAGSERKGLQSRNRSLLTGMARCKCGGPLSIFYDRRKRRFYRCSRNFLAAGGCPCEPGVLPAEEMERIVAEAVKARYGLPQLRQAALAEAVRSRAEATRSRAAEEWVSGHAAALAGLERRLAAIDKDLSRLRRAARRGEVGLATFEELRADAEAERKEVQEQRDRLEAPLPPARTDEAAAADWEKVDLWECLDVTCQREILYGLLRQMVMYKRRGGGAPEVELMWEREVIQPDG